MPNWTSINGKWVPAKETIALKNKSDEPFKYGNETIQPGEDFIYKGDDRSALEALAKDDKKFLGQDFRRNPEFLQAVSTLGFDRNEEGINKYLDYFGIDAEADKVKQEELMVTNKSHQIPKEVREKVIMGGGKDLSGSGNNFVGGFGDEGLKNPSKPSKSKK